MDEQLKQNIMLAVVAGGMTFMILNLLFWFIIPTPSYNVFLYTIIAIFVGGGVGAGTFFIKKSMDG